MADQKHTYAYRAINDEGVTLTGDIEAESAEQARQALLGRGLMPTEVTRRDGPLKSKRFQKFFQKPVTGWSAAHQRVQCIRQHYGKSR